MSFHSSEKNSFPSYIEENVWDDSGSKIEDATKNSFSQTEIVSASSFPSIVSADFTKCSPIELNLNDKASFPLWKEENNSFLITNDDNTSDASPQHLTNISSTFEETNDSGINHFEILVDKTSEIQPVDTNLDFDGVREDSELTQEGFGEFEVFNDFENNQDSDFGDFSNVSGPAVKVPLSKPNIEPQQKQTSYEPLVYLTSPELDFRTRLSTFLSEIWVLPNNLDIEELKKESYNALVVAENTSNLNSDTSSLQNELFRKINSKSFCWNGSSVEAKCLALNGVSQQTQQRFKKNLGNTFAPKWSFTLRPVKKNKSPLPVTSVLLSSTKSNAPIEVNKTQTKITSLEDFSAPVQLILKALPVLDFKNSKAPTSGVSNLIDPFENMGLTQEHGSKSHFSAPDTANNTVFNLLD